MHVYFIRHGETTSNTEQTIQGDDDRLTPRGAEDTEKLAKRISSIHFDHIITSPLIRCTETADIFKKVTLKDSEINSLFSEIKPPTSLVGKSGKDPIVVELNKERQLQIDNPDWKHEDEESFSECKARAAEAFRYLESFAETDGQLERNILVFTHGKFLRVLVGMLIYGTEMTKAQYLRFSEIFYIHNTGITKCTFKKAGATKPARWRVVHWNDHGHIIG